MMTMLVKVMLKHSRRFLAVNICSLVVPFTTSAASHQFNKRRYDPHYCRHKRQLENIWCNAKLENDKPARKELLRRLQIEYEIRKAEGCSEVPDEMDAYEWCDILEAKDEVAMFSRYRYIKSRQIDLQNWKKHNLQTEVELDDYIKSHSSVQTENSFVYIDEDCLESRQYIQNMTSDFLGYNLCPDIVLEFPQLYIEDSSDIRYARRQIKLLRIILKMNRRHMQPSKFHVLNCGALRENPECKAAFKALVADFPCVTFYNGNTFSEFRKDKLVYIMPCKPWTTDLLEDNSDDIPILLLSDIRDPSSLIKTYADSNGIRCASFPLHKYVSFTHNRDRYTFSVAESVGVLQDLYMDHNWDLAFTNNIVLPASNYFTQSEVYQHNREYRTQYKKELKKSITTKFVNSIK